VEGLTTEIFNYGSSEYHSRVLETIFVKFQIKLKNADVGAYDNLCYVLGWQLDAVFNRVREPSEVQCKDSDRDISRWNQAHQFLSKWMAG
jgi:hypothetical protein